MKNLKETIEAPRFVALYASLEIDDFVAVYEVRYLNYDERYEPLPDGQLRESSVSGWVRISEPVKMNFSPVGNDEIVRNAVSSLDEEERKLRMELHEKLLKLQDRRNQLLALTYQPETVA